jgi:hypothetical protein
MAREVKSIDKPYPRREEDATDEQYMVACFNNQWGTTLTTGAQVVSILSDKDGTLSWYRRFKAAASMAKAVPDQLEEVGMTPELWQKHLSAEAERSKVRKELQAECDRLRAEVERKIARLASDAEERLNALRPPVTRVVELNVTQLSVAVRGDLAKKTGAERSEATARAIAKTQKDLLDQIKAGVDPFRT